MGLFDLGLNAIKEKFRNTEAPQAPTTTQKKTPPPRKITFWRKFLSALKAFFAKK